jgi:hypothetical protein
MDQLNRVYIINIFCGRVIAKYLMVTGQAEQVSHPEAVCPEQITLDGNPVTVTARYLDNRFNTGAHNVHGGADAGHAYNR